MASDEWRTPPALFAAVDAEFHFTLDAAATPDNALCPRYYTKADDALRHPWEGVVWCNPPYSQLSAFVPYAVAASREWSSVVVLLLPAYTDTRYWALIMQEAHEIRWLHRRVAFLTAEGRRQTTARFPSALVICRPIRGRAYGRAPLQWVWDWADDGSDRGIDRTPALLVGRRPRGVAPGRLSAAADDPLR